MHHDHEDFNMTNIKSKTGDYSGYTLEEPTYKGTKTRFGSPGISLNSTKKHDSEHKGGVFIGEMKKHGIIEALNDINKFSEFFETAPNKVEDEGAQSQINPENIGSLNYVVQEDNKKLSCSMIETCDQNKLMTQKLDDHKNGHQQDGHNFKNVPSFLFPFQRRARSNSPPSEEKINLKI